MDDVHYFSEFERLVVFGWVERAARIDATSIVVADPIRGNQG
jgi:hypothetical protein